MVHASTQQLIRKLYELTGAGALAWQLSERETSRLETEGYVVELEPAPPTVSLLRADGRLLERAEPDALAAIAWPDGEGTYASRVTEMANRASRLARGAERVSPKPLSAVAAPPLGSPKPRIASPLAPFGKTQSFVVRPTHQGAGPGPISSISDVRPIQTPGLAAEEDPEPAATKRAPGSHIYKPWI